MQVPPQLGLDDPPGTKHPDEPQQLPSDFCQNIRTRSSFFFVIMHLSTPTTPLSPGQGWGNGGDLNF